MEILASDINSNMYFWAYESLWKPTNDLDYQKGVILIWCVNEQGHRESFAPEVIFKKHSLFKNKTIIGFDIAKEDSKIIQVQIDGKGNIIKVQEPLDPD